MRALCYFGFSLLLLACASETESVDSTTEALHHGHDAGTVVPSDAGSPPPSGDAGTGTTDPNDGTPTRVACTSSFGSGLSTGSHGRLDGTLVAIVPPGGSGCNSDSHHLHLQIAMQGGTYDIAVNISGVDVLERDMPIVDGSWSEGWHSDAPLDFPTTLGLHAGDFAAADESTLARHLEDLLANVNHVSVFATKYSKGGAHLIHRQGNNSDGALLLQPLGGTPHYVLFHFPNQTF